MKKELKEKTQEKDKQKEEEEEKEDEESPCRCFPLDHNHFSRLMNNSMSVADVESQTRK